MLKQGGLLTPSSMPTSNMFNPEYRKPFRKKNKEVSQDEAILEIVNQFKPVFNV